MEAPKMLYRFCVMGEHFTRCCFVTHLNEKFPCCRCIFGGPIVGCEEEEQ